MPWSLRLRGKKMLLDLKRALDEAGTSGLPVSVVDLSAALGVSVGEVKRMLDILVWRGDIEMVENSSCGSAGACARCPLRSVCAGSGGLTRFYRLSLPDASVGERTG